MIVEKIKSWIHGRVSFSASDGFPTRFLHACSVRKIKLYDLKVSSDAVSAAVDGADLPDLIDAADESGMDLKLTEKKGLGFLLQRYRFRWGIPVGLLLFVVLISVLASMLWTIEIRNLTCMKEEQVLAVLEEKGIRIGSFLRSVHCNEIEKELEATDEHILRVTVNLAGTGLYIDFSERETPQKTEKETEFANVYASDGGVIEKADYFAGVGIYRVGDAVVKGDLLVSGEMPMPDGSIRYVKADADVIVSTNKRFSVCSSSAVAVKQVARVKDRYGIRFFSIVLTPDKTRSAEKMPAGEFVFSPGNMEYPVGIFRNRTTEFEDTTVALSVAQQKLLCLTDLAARIREKDYFLKITAMEIMESQTGGFTLEANVTVCQNVAERLFFRPPVSERSPSDGAEGTEDPD